MVVVPTPSLWPVPVPALPLRGLRDLRDSQSMAVEVTSQEDGQEEAVQRHNDAETIYTVIIQ